MVMAEVVGYGEMSVGGMTRSRPSSDREGRTGGGERAWG
jgi:hypothetical protein